MNECPFFVSCPLLASPQHSLPIDGVTTLSLRPGVWLQACAMQALRLSHSGTVVMMHDYDKADDAPTVSPRAYRRTVSRWFDVLQHNDTLISLRPKVGKHVGNM